MFSKFYNKLKIAPKIAILPVLAIFGILIIMGVDFILFQKLEKTTSLLRVPTPISYNFTKQMQLEGNYIQSPNTEVLDQIKSKEKELSELIKIQKANKEVHPFDGYLNNIYLIHARHKEIFQEVSDVVLSISSLQKQLVDLFHESDSLSEKKIQEISMSITQLMMEGEEISPAKKELRFSLQQFVGLSDSAMLSTNELLLFSEPEKYEALERESKHSQLLIMRACKALSVGTDDPDDQKVWQQIEQKHNHTNSLRKKVYENWIVREKLTVSHKAILNELQKTIQNLNAKVNTQFDTLILSNRRFNNVTAVIILSFIILFSIILIRQITAPVKYLTSAVERLKGDDFDGFIPVTTKDEIGVLGTSFNEMIDQRKKIDSALKESKERYRSLIENQIDLVCRFTPGGKFVFVNDMYAQFFNKSKKELIGTKWPPLPVADDIEVIKEKLSKLSYINPTVTIENRVFSGKGEIHWVQFINTAIFDNNKKLIEIQSVGRDFTARKQAETALIESEDLFKHVFESANVGKSITLPTGEITVNKAFAELLGYSREALSNKTWPEVTLPDEIEANQKLMNSLLNGEQDTARLNKRYLHKNGSFVWADVSVALRRSIDGQPLHFITTVVDITERTRIEIELANALKYIQAIFEKSPIGIATLKANGQIITINHSLAQIVGGNVEEIVNLNIHEIASWRTSGMLAAAEEVLSTGIEKTREFHYISSFGKECWVSCRFVSFTHEGEQQLLLMLTDISGHRQVEEDHEKLQAQLQQAQKMESVGRLAGGVAHDYNNALSVIIGFTEMAMDEVNPGEGLHEDLSEILAAARRATEVTRQLLAFARKQDIAPIVLDLNGSMESMLKMIRSLIGEDIDLAWHPGAGLWPVKVDPSQIDQILANLCVNARDAIAGIGKITIETKTVNFDKDYCTDHVGFEPGGFVMLIVSDNGCGMNKEILEHIFEPFFTTKDVDKGTGLGLATVYGIVKQNNGFINVYSEPDNGTTVNIYLPRHEGDDTDSIGESSLEIPTGHGENVLLVEDELSILKLAKRILDGLEYTVLKAATPGEAISLAKKHKGEIELLVTDVIMPEMNGRELEQRLQSLNPNLKCLFMSGYTASVIAHHGVLEEGVHFIQKPFSKTDLAISVRKALDEATRPMQT